MCRALFAVLYFATVNVIGAGNLAWADDHDSLDRLKAMAFEDLLDIEVKTVSKRKQPLSRSAAAITVLTGEEIRRSGHTTIAEVLRMVPGMEVARINGHKWAITGRGLNGEFASKLLVMIDGRTVYTPLFAGVYWDVQHVMIEDIERIEVIRGPGGTVWGANAVNGVVNVITKSARDTHGMLASVTGGTLERAAGAARYGGQRGDVSYRVYGKAFEQDAFDRNKNGGDAGDDWWLGQGGFRLDWDLSSKDLVTFQGDYYDGEVDEPLVAGGSHATDVRGYNLLGRMTHTGEDESVSTAQVYYDRTEREGIGLEEERNTVDVELQHDRQLLDALHATLGLNYRLNDDENQSNAVAIASFEPESRTDHLVAGFLQLELSLLDDRLSLTGGTKLEYNEYTDFEYQPSARFVWQSDERWSLWGAVSRAVRTPSRSISDVRVENMTDATTLLTFRGSKDIDSEELLAYELGLRGLVASELSYDLALFYFDYDNLVSTEPEDPIVTPFPFFLELPFRLDNKLAGQIYGGELQLQWQVLESWRLSTAYSLTEVDMDPDGSSGDTGAKNPEKSSPTHQVQLRSVLDLPHGFEVDTAVYYVGSVKSQRDADGRKIGDYWRGDLRLGWVHPAGYELSLVGQNLFEKRHPEFGAVTAVPSYVPRSVYAKATIRH